MECYYVQGFTNLKKLLFRKKYVVKLIKLYIKVTVGISMHFNYLQNLQSLYCNAHGSTVKICPAYISIFDYLHFYQDILTLK